MINTRFYEFFNNILNIQNNVLFSVIDTFKIKLLIDILLRDFDFFLCEYYNLYIYIYIYFMACSKQTFEIN